MRIMLVIFTLLIIQNMAKATEIRATPTAETISLNISDAVSEDACTEWLSDNGVDTDENVDQCMDQSYDTINAELSLGNV